MFLLEKKLLNIYQIHYVKTLLLGQVIEKLKDIKYEKIIIKGKDNL